MTNPVATDAKVTVTATDSAGDKAAAQETVQAPVLQAASFPVTRIIGGNSTYLQFLLNAPAPAGYKLTLSSNNTALMAPVTFTFPAGHAVADVPVMTTKVTTLTIVTVTVTQGTTTQTATLTLLP